MSHVLNVLDPGSKQGKCLRHCFRFALLTRAHKVCLRAYLVLHRASAGSLPEHEYKGLERGSINDRYIMIYLL